MAAWWLRHHLPELKVRVVNVVDLMTLYPPEVHPHGLDDAAFTELFTVEKPVVFAFHGYQRAIHQLIHGRPHAARSHVRGFNEQGTTTTPFDMVVLNQVSRYHLCILALQHAPRLRHLTPQLIVVGAMPGARPLANKFQQVGPRGRALNFKHEDPLETQLAKSMVYMVYLEYASDLEFDQFDKEAPRGAEAACSI